MRWTFLSQSSLQPLSQSQDDSSNASSSSTPFKSTGITSNRPHSTPTLGRLDAVLKDEERYQELQYPEIDDVPGCMRLFDEFMMCYALMPQLRNIYRQGELRDCTFKFQDFKYCMSLKGDSPELKRELWVKRRAEWWAERRVSGSSEDVWDVRRTPLENFPPLHPEEIPSDSAT